MEPRFIVDTNVGHLVRKFRMLGYDTLFINPIHDTHLVQIAGDEERVILSGDKGIFERRSLRLGKVRGFWVDTYQDRILQLQQILRAFRQGAYLPFIRCLECNTLLTSKWGEEAKGRVPSFVYRTVKKYAYCPCCDQFFWEGDHVKRMREVIQKL